MVLISHPAPSQSTADLCAATRVVHTETRGIPWAKGKRNTWESYLFSLGTFGMCMVCMDNCKFQVFAGLSCNICPEIFVLSSSWCYTVKLFSRLLWHLCSTHLWFEGNHHANILWARILSPYSISQFSVANIQTQRLSRNLGSTDPVQ